MVVNFSRITIRNWRQFKSIDIVAHPKLTIITGANGAGKSTLLNLFSQHFGYARPFLSTPKKLKGGGISYDSGHYTRASAAAYFSYEDNYDEEMSLPFSDEELEEILGSETPPGSFVHIGDITYTNGVSGQLGYHEQQVNSYGISIQNQQAVTGVQIGSHRTISTYQPVQAISLQTIVLQQSFQQYYGEVMSRMSGGHSQYSPLYRMKETLIAMAAFGEGNAHLDSNKELLDAFNGFVKILKKVLPTELGFRKILVRLPDIVLDTKSGEFILDSSSGGINAIIEIAWQLYLFSLTTTNFVVTMDEPENHLHPSMQRSILPSLMSAFPNVQFIVATHSPFVVSSVEESFVYALKYVGSRPGPSGLPTGHLRRVRSIKLDQTRKAGTASEILREVLGVDVTIPDWAQTRLNGIVEKYQNSEVSKQLLSDLRVDLSKAGFSEFYSDALAKIVNGR